MRTEGKPTGHVKVTAAFPWLRAAAAVAALNTLFALSLLWQAALPTDPVKERVRHAFSSGELVHEDRLHYDSRRGIHQFTDCVILKMLIDDDDVVAKAFSPGLHDAHGEQCASLFEMIQASFDEEDLDRSRYSRFWHGYLPLSAALLQVADLSEIRPLLKWAVYGSLIVLVVAAGTQHLGFLAVAASVAATGALVWAVPYFGQSLSHGPGDAFVILGIAALAFWRERLARAEALIPFCAAYGAGVVYFEFFTGLLPTAAGLLFPFAYLVATARPGPEVQPARGLIVALAALVAFALGGLGTLAAKQALSLALVDRGAIDVFAGQLSYYTSMVPEDIRANILEKHSYLPEWLVNHWLVVLLLPFGSFLWYADSLTYGMRSAGLLVYGASGLAWLLAAALAVSRKNRRRQVDFLAFVAGASIIPLWTIVFPTHTILHADYIVRIMIVPISLGWAALLWQVLAGRILRSAPSRAAASEGGH
jgi:hypothetical protein